MTEEKNYYSDDDLIAYVNGTLPQELCKRIEVDRKASPALEAAISEHAHLKCVLQYPTLLNDIAFLRTVPPPAKILGLEKAVFIKVAASVMFIFSLSMGSWYYSNQQFEIKKQKSLLLVKQFLNEKPDNEVYSSDLTTIGNGNLITALTYYRAKDYKSADSLFTKLRQTAKEPQLGEMGIYIATCRLRLQRYSEAKVILKELLQKAAEDDANFLNAIRWHLALAYLAEPTHENIEQACNYLQVIPKDDGYYGVAQEMLKKIGTLSGKLS